MLPVLLMPHLLWSQHFQIGQMDMEFTDPGRKGRVIEALVLYPSDSGGCDVPLALPDRGGFPVVVFGHGYQMPVEPYHNIWDGLVPEGFVVVLPRTGSGMFPSHERFGKDMAFLLEEMIRFSSDSATFFSGKLHESGCLMGHSMGGGAAILGAVHGKLVRTLVLLAPLDTRPSSAKAARELTIPALVFAGSQDRITPPEKHQQPIYDSLPGLHKTYISILGGTHCQMAESHQRCDAVEKALYPEPGISREEQHRVLDRYLLPWLQFYLRADSSAGSVFDQELLADPAVSYRREGNFSKNSW